MLRLYPKRDKGAGFYLHMVRMALEKGLCFIIVVGVSVLHVAKAWGMWMRDERYLQGVQLVCNSSIYRK
ncbi:unnamed protein product, partial [Callosobruchus maculatus]